MDSILALTIHWPRKSIHFEDFAGVPTIAVDSRPFQVRQSATGRLFDVTASQTLLEALRDAGITLPSSCESGTCGTCRTRLIAGSPEHRDIVLSEEERSRFIMPCVSRSGGDVLELDF
jgi:phthalate 4,5-dioxygenase reductase subunit